MDTSHPPQEQENQEKEKQEYGNAGVFFLEFIKVAIMAALIIVFTRHLLFKPFYVKGQSMEPTFYEKEYLIIDELTYHFREPHRGEVIVFHAPLGEKDYYLKRVIGLPGERVKVEDNKVIIYNNEHPEGIVVQENYLSEPTPGSMSVTLGPDQFFVMGDNRDASFDSRRFGPIKRDTIVGRTWLRGWPLERVDLFTTLPEYNL